jgi:hypothetical protein
VGEAGWDAGVVMEDSTAKVQEIKAGTLEELSGKDVGSRS